MRVGKLRRMRSIVWLPCWATCKPGPAATHGALLGAMPASGSGAPGFGGGADDEALRACAPSRC